MDVDFYVGQYGTSAWYLNGWIDEFRVSKGIAQWTSGFTPSTRPYAAAARTWLVGSPRPLKGVKYYVSGANTVASTMAVSTWNGNSWQTLTATDNTDTGATLAVSGTVTWASTVGTAKIRYLEGYLCYWYQFSIDAGEAVIYHMTLDAPFQQITDIWDGTGRVTAACFKYTTAYTDYTINVYDDIYDSADPTTYADLSSLGAFSDPNNCMICGFIEQMAGITVGMASDKINAEAAVLSIEHWDGTGWATISGIVDGTAEGGAALAKSGVISWAAPEEQLVFKRVLANNSSPLYYYRFHWGGALGATTGIYYISGIPAQKTIRGYKFPLFGQGRLMLCNNVDEDRNAVLYAADGMPQTFNGSDSGKIYLGDNTDLICGCNIFSQFAQSLYTITLIFKEKETWALTYDSQGWHKYPVSELIGCNAPKTLKTVVIPPVAEDKSGNRNLAIWMNTGGVYVSDGRHPILVSHDIRDLFDQTSATHINLSYAQNAAAWVDQEKLEYHLVFATTAGAVTANDVEWTLDLKRWKWWKASRGTNLQCGISVSDSYGSNYSYGFIDTGYMERLEYGNTQDGTAITSTFQTGDFPLAEGDYLTETRVLKFIQVMATKATTTANVKLTHFVDTQEEILTLDVAAGTAWAVNDVITGETSGTKCEIVKVYSTTVFSIRNRTGDFTLNEILVNQLDYHADQGAAHPTVTGPTDYSCDPTLSYYRTTFPVKDANSTPGIFHSIRETITVSNETTGFEPIILGLYYEAVREHLS